MYMITNSFAYNKCVQRNCEAVPWTAERFGVQTHYYRLPMWPVMCESKNAMVQQTQQNLSMIRFVHKVHFGVDFR